MRVALTIWQWLVVYYLLSNALGDEAYWQAELELEPQIKLPPELCEEWEIAYTESGITYPEAVLQVQEPVARELDDKAVRLILQSIGLNRVLSKAVGRAIPPLRKALDEALAAQQAALLWSQLPEHLRQKISEKEMVK